MRSAGEGGEGLPRAPVVVDEEMEEVEEGVEDSEEEKYCDGEGGHIVQKNFGVRIVVGV